MRQKGFISPILVIVILAAGIFFGTQLVQQQQIFKSNAYDPSDIEQGFCALAIQDQKDNIAGKGIGRPKNCNIDYDNDATDQPAVCTSGGWKTYKEMRTFLGGKWVVEGRRNYNFYDDVNNCNAFDAFQNLVKPVNNQPAQATTGGTGSGGTATSTSGDSSGPVIGGGGNKPTDEDLRRCNEAVQKNLNIGRERCSSDTNQVGICTYAGWKSYADMKKYMEEQGWTGNYGTPASYCALLDAFWGQKDNKGQCVARVQEEYRRSGAVASADPWAPYKVVALGNTVNLGALNDKGRGNFSLDRVDMFLTGPDGISRNVRSDPLFKQTAQGVYAFTPNQSGHYKLVASGSSSNDIRCAVEASFDVSATCASACSQCIVNNLGGSLQYVLREGGADRWKNEQTGTACPSYDAMVEHWSQKIISPPLKQYNEIKSDACALSCSDEANTLSAPPPNPGNVRLICTSDTKVRISWDRVPGSAYKARLNNTTKGTWKVCNETEGDLCRDIPMWKQTAESIELPVSRNETYQVWLHASNSVGDSPGTQAVTFSCPAGVRTEAAPPAGPAPAVRQDPNAPRLSNLTVTPNPVQRGQPIRITGSISQGKIHVRIFPNDKGPAVGVAAKLDSSLQSVTFDTNQIPQTDSLGQPVTFATVRFQGQNTNGKDLNGNNGLPNVVSDLRLDIR